MGKSLFCAECRRVAYADGLDAGVSLDGIDYSRTPLLALEPIRSLRNMLLGVVLDRSLLWRRKRATTKGRQRYVRPALEYVVTQTYSEIVGPFIDHLMEMKPGRREAHVRGQPHHTSQMIDAARYLDARKRLTAGWRVRARVFNLLLGFDDFPDGVPRPMVSDEWIRKRISI